MTARFMTVGADQFAMAFGELLDDVDGGCEEAVNQSVVKSVRKGAKTVQSYAEKGGKHPWSDEYVGGFSSHVTRGGKTPEGEIGNKNKPGLVHLLEKGHNTLTGRKTTAYPHMAPAFDEIAVDFYEMVCDAVGRAL